MDCIACFSKFGWTYLLTVPCQKMSSHCCGWLVKSMFVVMSAQWHYNQVTVHPTVLHYPSATCKQHGDKVHRLPVWLPAIWYLLASDHHRSAPERSGHQEGCGMLPSTNPCYHSTTHPKSQTQEWALIFCWLAWLTEGPCDACCGVCRMAVNHSVLVEGGGEGVQNEEELFHHLAVNYLLPDPKEAATSTGSCWHKNGSFHLVFITHFTVPGTLQIHQVQGLTSRSIFTRKLACFCNHCCGLNG